MAKVRDIARVEAEIMSSDGGIAIRCYPALDSWLGSLNCANTVRNYRATLSQFFRVRGMPVYLKDVTPAILAEWRRALIARTALDESDPLHLAAATMNRHLAAARKFFNYWRALGQVSFSGDAQAAVLENTRTGPRKKFQILQTEGEITALIDAAQESGEIGAGLERVTRKRDHAWTPKTDATAERDALIVTVALATGLRCAELADLAVGDLLQYHWDETAADGHKESLEAWALHVRHGKGDKDREVWISNDDAKAVLAYIRNTGRAWGKPALALSPLFQSTGNRNKGGKRPMHVNSIRKIIDNAADRAQAAGRLSKPISPHSLRHTYAISLLKGDPSTGRRPATIMEVKELLGHSSVLTTQRYLEHLDSRERAGLAPTISRLRHTKGKDTHAS